MRLHCFFTVNSLVNAAGDHLASGSFMEKEKIKTFLKNYVISLSGVVVRCSCVESKVQGSSPTVFYIPSFLFFPFLVLLFSINM